VLPTAGSKTTTVIVPARAEKATAVAASLLLQVVGYVALSSVTGMEAPWYPPGIIALTPTRASTDNIVGAA